MRLRVEFLLLAVILLTGQAIAQCIALDADCQLGILYDDDDARHCVLPVKNIGSDTVCIVNVRPSCGCLHASASADMLAPGDTAAVEITFSPQGITGRFDKTVDVVTTANRLRLHVRGEVLMSASTVARRFPVAVDSMLFSSTELVLGKEGGILPIRCYNAYSRRATTIVVTEAPSFLRVKPLLDPILPGQVCTVLVEAAPQAASETAAVPQSDMRGDVPVSISIIDTSTAEPLATLHFRIDYQSKENRL